MPGKPINRCARWIGAAAEEVAIGSERFSLSFSHVGETEIDPINASMIDPRLEISRDELIGTPARQHSACFKDWAPSERRAYLHWISAGRIAANAPRSFLLLFLSSVEHAIVQGATTLQLGAIREEIARLLELHAADPVFVAAAGQLLQLCGFLDPGFIPAPIPATAETNFRDEMPFGVRHYLGWMLANGGRLEPDEALLFYLQQPGRRLEPLVAQYFRELHASWCVRFSRVAADCFADVDKLPRLTLAYEAMHGAFAKEFTSDLPDVAAFPVPTALEVLFRECAAPLLHLRNEPVGRVLASLPVPIASPEATAATVLSPRPDGPARLSSLIREREPRVIPVQQLLEMLFDGPGASPGALLPQSLGGQVSRVMDEAGFGYEPDWRSGLPRSLHPDRRITVFRTGCRAYQPPSDQLLVAQAGLVLSGIARLHFPSLKPLEVSEIEERLPFRHRFSDLELARLHATDIALANLDESPREFLRRWVKQLARTRRLDDLVGGFALAFRGQRRSRDLARLARAATLDCPGLIDPSDLEAAAADVAIPQEAFHYSLRTRVEALQPAVVRQAETSAAPLVQDCPRSEKNASQPKDRGSLILDGLDMRDAELLLALHDRARTSAELRELARSRGLAVAAALERINEWALLRFGSTAVVDNDGFALARVARDFIDQLMASQ